MSVSHFRRVHKEPVAPAKIMKPARQRLDGASVSLEPIDPAAQVASLYRLTHGDEVGAPGARVWTYLPYGPFDSEQALSEWQSSLVTSDDPLFFSWLDHASGQHTGMGSFMRIEPAARCIEIGHLWMAPSFQNTRASTECLFLMMRHAFDDLHYRRLEWKCDAMNTPSRNAATRLGFTYEGTFYRATIVKGHNRDTAWYSIIDEEWPDIRAAFEQWLDDSNFDADGLQKHPLQARYANVR